MATYLLIWNPNLWHWWDELGDSFERKRGKFEGNWSSGRTKSILPHDRLFLIRLGKEPRGIVASGFATSKPKLRPHWDETLAKKGKKALYVDCQLEIILNPGREPILTMDQLSAIGFAHFNWSPRASGVQIPDEIAARLETLWARFLGRPRKPFVVPEASAVEGLRTEIVTYSRGRSRALRDAALSKSAGVCEACDVDYSQVLSGKGLRVLQVHHRKQLCATDTPRVVRLQELAILCANCHSLVHMNPHQAIPVETLRRMLLKERKRVLGKLVRRNDRLMVDVPGEITAEAIAKAVREERESRT
jgi:5-methylcytosine-specific restriction protein A